MSLDGNTPSVKTPFSAHFEAKNGVFNFFSTIPFTFLRNNTAP